MTNQSDLYIVVIVSLVLAIFFGGLGASFLSTDRTKSEGETRGTGLSSLILSLFRSKPGVFVTSMHLGYFISIIAFTFAFTKISGPFFYTKLHLGSLVLIVLMQIISALLILLFTVFLLRLSIFRVKPESAMRYSAAPALLFYIVFFLVSVIILAIINLISRYIFGIEKDIRKEGFFHFFTFPEFYSRFLITNSIKESSENKEPEVKIFQNVLEFSKLKVRDCMVPRNEIEALEVNSNLVELRDKFVESGYSKILVYENTIDNIIGYISSRELFKKPQNIKSRLVTMSIVPESRQINKLLRNLIKERRSIALVVDEYGGTSGIITLEDIMEEIFGEIEDEHDTQEFVERQVNENEFILSGRLEIDDLNEKYRFDIPETEDYDTLAGYIIFHYQNIPKLNTNLVIENLHIRILKVSQTRIELVHVTRIIPPEE